MHDVAELRRLLQLFRRRDVAACRSSICHLILGRTLEKLTWARRVNGVGIRGEGGLVSCHYIELL